MTISLYLGAQFSGIAIVPDHRWSGMWRVSKGDYLSDMVNLSRAKDAAISLARSNSFGGSRTARWRRERRAT